MADFPVLEPADQLGGVPDEYERLWTPHRLVYLTRGQHPPDNQCPFCLAPRKTDEAGLIVFRAGQAYALLNLYPYNTGHLLVCPYRHYSTYDLASAEEVAQIGLLTQQAMRVLTRVFNCDGFNIGLNQGKVAGAGVAGHLHQHIVPRWARDANFFPIIAKTKALPRLLGSVREKVAQAWEDMVLTS